MAISVFPEPVSSASTDGVSFTIPAEATQYKLAYTFPAGIYSITTSPTTSQVFIEFNIAGVITSATTVSGSISVNLASECSEVYVSGIPSFTANTLITIDKTGENISGTEITGTLDTLTTSGTYNQTGKLYVVAVGGGGGGGASGNYGGGGGGSGGVASKMVFTNTATSYTIGTSGNGGAKGNTANNGAPGNAGNVTNFGNLLTANGGGGGATGNTGAGGAAGTPGGGAGSSGVLNGDASNASSSTKIGQSVKSGTTGGGGGGSSANGIGAGGGDGGIGTGGSGGNNNTAPGNGSGYGSGGGGGRGGASTTHDGGNGAPGVIYVLRGF